MKMMECEECGLRYAIDDRDTRRRELICADDNCNGDVVDVEEVAEDEEEEAAGD